MNFSLFRQSFYDKRTDKRKLVKQIKTFCENYDSLTKFIVRYRKDLNSATSLLNHAIIGKNHLPKLYEDLGSYDLQYFTDSLEQEMNWQAIAFLECHKIINEFIQLKSEFEHYLLVANYEQARKVLDKIELDICISYWSIENRFIIDEYQFGTEKNWETRNKVVNGKNNAFVQIFGSHASFKTESRVTFFQYNEEFNNWQEREGLNKYSEFEGLIEYFRFKGNYYSYSKYNHLSEIIYRESNASIIDRYLLFIRTVQHFISEEVSDYSYILILLRELYGKINDIALKQMILATDQTSKLQTEDINFEIIQIFDEYTKGNYQQSVILSKFYILKHSSISLELFEIYSKSLIELNFEYSPITENDSLLNKITLHYYNILSKNLNTDSSLVDLVKLSYTFNNSHVGLHLYSFVSSQLGWLSTTNYSFLENLNSKFINPRLILNLFTRPAIAKAYFKNLNEKTVGSNAVNLFTQFYNNYNSGYVNIEFENVPENRNNLYKIRSLFLKEMIEECIQLCEALLEKQSSSNILEYEIVNNLFSCYLKKKDFRNCIILFVNTYLKNPHLTYKMAVNELTGSIIKEKFKNIGKKSNLIEFPILLKINGVDKIKVKQAYELFLKGNNVNKPSELIAVIHNLELNKLIYFLKFVCIPEIMQLSKYFNSTYEVNEERISIIKFLAVNDIVDVETYKTEIAELTQKNTISKVIGGIDERKIFVNEYKIRQTIKKSDKQNVLINEQVSPLTNESFDRYVKLLAYVKNNNEYKDVSSIIQFGENGEVTYMEAEKNKTFIEQGIDIVLYVPAFRIFVTYFLNIRDLFIFNKEYGLEAYLSTRIRHGTLPNHLRSVFETYYLVTAQTDNVYAENQYWTDKLNLSKGNMTILQNALGEFSKEVDTFSKEIKDTYIQCKNEQKNEKLDALFDYSYDENELIFLFLEDFNETENIDVFIDKSFHELWRRTVSNLEDVREKFNGDFRDRYIYLIDNLQSVILSTLDKSSVSELLNNLMTCRTEIQTKLSNISKWFMRSESSFEGVYELITLVETSIQITKNLNPNFNFEIDKNICPNFNISGEYHQHIIDLMNNCMFNIIKHSHLPSELVNAKLIIEENGNNLLLNFENCISDSSLHLLKLNNIKKNWGSSDANISKEEGSGYPKIKKIINSDLTRKCSNFDFILLDNKLNIIISFETNGLKV